MLTYFLPFVYTIFFYSYIFLTAQEALFYRICTTGFEKKPPEAAALIGSVRLLFLKRTAVCALIRGGIALVRPHADLVQRTVVRRAAMVPALRDRAFDAVIRVLFVHTGSSFPNGFGHSLPRSGKEYSVRLPRTIRREVVL
jgi:hypothetical protein